MAKRMLIDATHAEETRVVVLNGNRLEEFDFETSTKKQLKGNIYLAKVTRVEPSLQAAFVEFGGNRHGFLAFSEIHPDYYQIPVADRVALLREHEEALAEEAEEEEAEAEAEAEGSALDGAAEAAESDDAEGGTEEEENASAESEDGDESGDAAQDNAVIEIAETAETTKAEDDAENADEDDAEAPAETPSGGVSEVAVPISLEEVGGEDEDELPHPERRRSRPRRQRYKIQEVIKRRQILLVQVVKEERGNKGAALTTYLSLAGRYCVLMPNTGKGGGVSRKITNPGDRKRLKTLITDLDIPEGMAVILRTAAVERSKAELKRDFEFLNRAWDQVRELTLNSIAPTLVYEEANLIKRSIRDLYTKDIDEVQVEGEEGYKTAKDFMRMLMPSHAKKVQPYRDPEIPLFHRYQVESQLDAMHSPQVQLKSGGYLVINPTEALVSIDVNSGRATRERNIEETALKTNLEAADEIARQLKLRDLAGLVVIDFIDMAEHRNQNAVERRVKEAMRNDRARIQIGRISAFGLLELSRQRLRPSLLEASTQICPHCAGTGLMRSTESSALHVLRAMEEEGIRHRSTELHITVAVEVALYILNQKRDMLHAIERRYGFRVFIAGDDRLIPPEYNLERVEGKPAVEAPAEVAVLPAPANETTEESADDGEERGTRRKRRRRGRRGRRNEEAETTEQAASSENAAEGDTAEDEQETTTEADAQDAANDGEEQAEEKPKRRRRGRRGGRRRSRKRAEAEATMGEDETGETIEAGEEEKSEAAAAAADTADATESSDSDTKPEAKSESKPKRPRRSRSRKKAEDSAETKSETEGARPENGETPAPKTEPEPAMESPNGNGADATETSTDTNNTPERDMPSAAEADTAENADTPRRRGWWNRFGN